MSASHSVEPGTAARVRFHATPGMAITSGDANCISRPHQPGEVIAAADDVQIDVLAEVEAGVAVGAAEACRVDVEDDERSPAAAHRLENADPVRFGAGRDHGDRTPGQPTHALTGERLRQRCIAVRLRDGEAVENEPVLTEGPVRLEEGAARVVGNESYLANSAVDHTSH